MSSLNEHLHGLNKDRAGRGGKRQGSGRKKGDETVTLSYRVKKDKSEQINLAIKNIISSLS